MSLVFLSHPALAAETEIHYVTCPIYRDVDAGKKSGCWLADETETGKRYDVFHSITKPQLGHEILVEGTPSGEKDICGGIVLKPARVAVLETTCPEFMLPAEGYPGTPFVLPPRTLRPYYLPSDAPPPPYASRDFNLFFDLNGDFIIYQQTDFVVEDAAKYIVASKAKQVTVTGYAATQTIIASKRKFSEPLSLAKSRAQKVVEALVRLGVDKSKIKVEWKANPAPVETEDGMKEASKRRVTISIGL